MALNIRPSTSTERKLLFIETLLNSTDKISKVSDNSVVSGIAGGVSKVAGKAEKDIVVAASQLFPDTAFGSQLDQVAANFGIAPRLGSIGSSTYVKITADPGTLYASNTHTFSSSDGVKFELEDDVRVGDAGFIYAKVKSLTSGREVNVAPLMISKVNPKPAGHIDVVNEYAATGGRDVESDEVFRIRIKDGANILARGTIASIEQLFMKINNKVLKVISRGSDKDGKINLAIITQNGSSLSQLELDELLSESADSFGLTEMRPFGKRSLGVRLSNIEYQPVDISFRVSLDGSTDVDQVRIAIQTKISKYLDFRFFDSSRNKVEWSNLLEICKSVAGVDYVPDQYFLPRVDLAIDSYKVPRVRSFLMLDMQGQIIGNSSGTLSPVYYPSVIDESYHHTILKNIV